MSKKNKHKQQQQKTDMESTGATVRQIKAIPGLMSCAFVHTVPSGGSTAEFNWTGDTLNAIWPTVLAFLKWTYDTYKSESQLRLFVNKNTGEWAPWAFPQKANTGMTAHEITETDDKDAYARTMQQRAQFSDTDGWYYWGTVHHHCSGGAFQSGTDTANEKNQDGIHITVGNMDKDQFDIHFRMYVGGFRLKSITELTFWDTGDEMNTVPPKFRSLLPSNTEQLLAKQQMGIPAPQGTEFPQEWRDNIIDVRPKQQDIVVSRPVTYSSGGGTNGNVFYGRTYLDMARPATDWDKKRGTATMIAFLRCTANDPHIGIKTMDGIIKALETLDKLSEDEMNIFALCVECDILPGDLALFLDEQMAMAELKEEQRRLEMENEGAPAKDREERKGHQPPNEVIAQHNHWYFGGG